VKGNLRACLASTLWTSLLSEKGPVPRPYPGHPQFKRGAVVHSLVSSTIIAVSVIAITTPQRLAAQNLAQRIANAPDGVARVQFASRPGTCGNGRDMVGYRKALFSDSFESMGDWHSRDCVPGPVRVALSISAGKVIRVETSVGTSWPTTSDRVTDLGVVAAPDAASYFFSLVPVLERVNGKSRILLPAVLADAGDVTPQLTSIARDATRIQDTRRQAIHWLGILGDARVVPTLVAFARGGETMLDRDDDGEGTKGLGSAAMAALGFLQNGVGIPALIELARSGSAGIRRSAVFWLGQSGDPRALASLHGVIENQREDQRIREHAIFSLAHGSEIPASEFAYLRNIFPRLGSESLKKAVLMGMAEDEMNGSAWLIDRARDTSEPLEIRKTALFWAGQRALTPTRDLASYYRSASEPSLKEHAIFVLSQRKDDAAFNELMRIAREDGDKRMRARALFWLGQKDDPRVAKLIQDKIER
jgi:HEAT repeat protein